MDNHCFDSINSEQKAYWLGFLFADGCNYISYFPRKSYKILLTLSIKDKGHLKKYCKFLNISNKSIKCYKPRVCIYKKRKITGKGTCCVNVYSKYTSLVLKGIGMVERKSLILKFPKLKKYLIRHFIRGYFDGDGHIGCVTFSGVKRYRIVIVSSKSFCKSLIKIAKKIINVNFTLRKNDKIHIITLSGNRQVKIFTDWLYKKSNVYLDRKHAKYLKLLEHIKSLDSHQKYSKYTGITYDKDRHKWVSFFRIKNKSIYIGRFSTEIKAYRARQYFKRNFNTTEKRRSTLYHRLRVSKTGLKNVRPLLKKFRVRIINRPLTY